MRRLLPTIGGASDRVILDVGCGDKPYREWFGPVKRYVGIDVYPGPEVDVVISPERPWPFADAEFDVVLCSQVLEHVEHPGITISEIKRVLKPNGRAVVSIPFLYNEHGAPHDFRRLTVHGARRSFDGMVVEAIEVQGGIGSTVAILLLNWWDQALARSFPLRLLKAMLLPVTILASLVLNVVGLLFDCVDKTDAFYSNVLIVLRKEPLA